MCTEGKLPELHSAHYSIPLAAGQGVSSSGPATPPSILPPHSQCPQCPPWGAKQVKGHIDPLLKSSWSGTNLKSSQPCSGAWWPLSPRDGWARAELQGLSRTARDWRGAKLSENWVELGLAFPLSICLMLLGQLSAGGSLPASKGRGCQTRNSETCPIPSNTTDSKGSA